MSICFIIYPCRKLNDLLVTRQIDNTSPGDAPGDILAEEIRETGRSLQSLVVCGKKSNNLILYTSLLAEGIVKANEC